jgi:hypothetical protein
MPALSAGNGRSQSARSHKIGWNGVLGLLEAVAVAIRVIETDALTACGSEAALLLPEPRLEASDGRTRSASPMRRITDAARGLFRLVLFGRTDGDAIRRVRGLLLNVGTPAELLSQ